MIVNSMLDNLTADEKAVVRFDERRCLRRRLNKNKCRSCVDQCKAAALTVVDGSVLFEGEKCTGCLRCAAACPNDAFSHGVDFFVVLKMLQENENVTFSCNNDFPHSAINQLAIPCVGFISEPLLAAMNSAVRNKLFVDVSRCHECCNRQSFDHLQEAIFNLRRKIGDDGELRIALLFKSGSLPASDRKTERRFVLELLRKSLADISKEALTVYARESENEVLTDSHRDKRPVQKTTALQFSLDSLRAERVTEKNILSSYFYTVSADERCSCCPLCSGMCPTGALKRRRENGRKQLFFNSAFCSGCGLCQEFCRAGALTVKQGGSDKSVTVIWQTID